MGRIFPCNHHCLSPNLFLVHFSNTLVTLCMFRLNYLINQSKSSSHYSSCFHGFYDPSFFVTVIMGMTSYECSLYRSSKWRNIHDTSAWRHHERRTTQNYVFNVFSSSSNRIIIFCGDFDIWIYALFITHCFQINLYSFYRNSIIWF